MLKSNKIFYLPVILLIFSYCASGPSKEKISSVQNQVSTSSSDGQLIQSYRVILLPPPFVSMLN